MTMRPYEGYDRVDLTQGMRNKDKPKGPDDGWWAGQQMDALSFYAPEELKIIGCVQEEDYSGDIWAIAEWTGKEHRWVLIKDGFGSCSGCDALEGGQDGYGYVEDVLRENTVQFLSVSDMEEYIKESKEICDADYWNAKAKLLEIVEGIPVPKTVRPSKTRYRAVTISQRGIGYIEFKNVVEASTYENTTRMVDPNIQIKSFGDINGEDYTVVYYEEGRI